MKTNRALQRLRHHVSGAIERGETQAIVEIPTINWTLKYYTTINGKDAYFKSMGAIGPMLTTNPEEAMRFSTEDEAMKNPAFSHPLCLLETHELTS